SNKVVEIIGTFTIRSFGASYNNGFGFQLPNNNVNTANVSVSGYSLNRGYITVDGNGWETGQNKPTIIVYDNTFDHMAWPGSGIGVNTDPNGTYVQPATFTITMTFNSGLYTAAQVGIESFNPFLIVNQNRNREVHLPNYAPTAKADISLMGTVDDDSNAGSGRYYVTENNLPWALNTPVELDWAQEKVDIVKVYKHFEAWAESAGQQYPDWYTNQSGYVDQTKIYNAQ
ncbi:MAG: LruC domain-containing protein, partial [Owenweeksia sp.]